MSPDPETSTRSNRLSYMAGSGTIPPVPMSPQNTSGSMIPAGPPPPVPVHSSLVETLSSPAEPPFSAAPPPPAGSQEGVSEYDADEDSDKNTFMTSPEQTKRASIIRTPSQRAPPPPPPSAPAPQEPAVEDFVAPIAQQAVFDAGRRSLDRSATVRRSMDQPNRGSMDFSTNRRSMDFNSQSKRISMDYANTLPNISESSQILAAEFDLQPDSEWWRASRGVPPSIAARPDVTYEIEESQRRKRGGITFLVRDIYVLFADCSQTIVTVEFSDQTDHIGFQQRIEPPPATLRQDQLEHAYMRFGRDLASSLPDYLRQSFRPGQFLPALLQNVPESLPPIGNRAYGALIYHNLANASVRQEDVIRPGDIAVFRGAKFQGHKGGLHQKYTKEVGGSSSASSALKDVHAGVVHEWDGTKRKIRIYEQVPEGKIKSESYKLGDLKSGEVKVYRIVGRDYVGWN